MLSQSRSPLGSFWVVMAMQSTGQIISPLLATDTVLNPIEQLSPIALGNLAYISLFLERTFIGILVRNGVLEHLL